MEQWSKGNESPAVIRRDYGAINRQPLQHEQEQEHELM